jgi:hypothetical protein
MNKINVSKQYLQFRNQVLSYTNVEMNLELENDEQVYIAVFDIPTESGMVYCHTKTLALLFGLNTHIYIGNGDTITGLEENKNVMQAMQSLLISSPQVLGKMQLVEKYEFYNSKNVRAYLKTRKGLYFKEINSDCKEDRFLMMLLENVLGTISMYI